MIFHKIKKVALIVIFSFGIQPLCFAIQAGSPFFYIESNNQSDDIRIETLAMTGALIAVSATVFKLLDERHRAEFCKKNKIENNKEALINFLKQLVPSTSSALLIGGLLLIITSKNVIHFCDGLFKTWALDQLHIYDNGSGDFSRLADENIKNLLSV